MLKTKTAWLKDYLYFNILFAYVLALPYLSFFKNTQTQYLNPEGLFFSKLFFICAYLGQLALLITLPLSLLYLLRFLPKASLSLLGAFVSTLSLSLLICDIRLYSLYHFHFNGVILQFFLQGGSQEILGLSSKEYASLTLIFMSLLGLEYALAKICWKKWHFHRWSLAWFAYLFPALALFFSYVLFFTAADKVLDADSLRKDKHAQASIVNATQLLVQTTTFPFYHQFLQLFAPNLHLSDTFRTYEGVFKQGSFDTHPLRYPLQPLVYGDTHDRPNVLIIGVDAWRADMLDPKITPQLFAFSSHCHRFHEHSSGGNGTQPGLFSLFYSLPGTYWDAALKSGKGPLLLKIFQDHHYDFGLFVSAQIYNPPYNKTIFHDYPKLRRKTPGETPAQRDRQITQDAIHFIESRKVQNKPFFAFVFYNTSHSYCNQGDYPQLFQPALSECNRLLLNKHSPRDPLFNRYKNALHFVDTQAAQIVETLKKTGQLDHTLVIITGDHGEEFNDNDLNFWGHASNYTAAQTHTPLLIYWPSEASRDFFYPTSHYDILPTLAERLFNCQNDHQDYSVGKNLFKPSSSSPLIVSGYIDYGIVDETRIIRVLPEGSIEVTNKKNQPVSEHAKPEHLKLGFLETHRFYADYSAQNVGK